MMNRYGQLDLKWNPDFNTNFLVKIFKSKMNMRAELKFMGSKIKQLQRISLQNRNVS